MASLADCCAPGTIIVDKFMPVAEDVSLRVITFSPAVDYKNPIIFIIPGWISTVEGCKTMLSDFTRDHTVIYMETREKPSAKIFKYSDLGVEKIGEDIAAVIHKNNLLETEYILLGSSLGATGIIEGYHLFDSRPKCLIMIGPNAAFGFTFLAKIIIRVCPVSLYQFAKPFIKWYMKINYLDVGADPDQYKNYSDLLNDIEPRRVKRSALANFDYTVWQRLSDIDCPALILGGSSDVMHNPLNVELIVKEMKDVQYIDLEINSRTHGQEAIDIMRSFMDLGEAKV